MAQIKYEVDIDMQSKGRVVNLLDAVAAQEPATLAQLQLLVRGLDWKDSVRAASTANVVLTAPGTSLDGVTLANPNRVLLKDQTAPAENGIYVWTASGATLTRSLDADGNPEVTSGMTVQVEEGTANADKWYTLTTDNPIVLDTTALVFANTGSGTTGFTIAGAGLTGTGSTVDVGAGTGILANANDVAVDTSVVVRKATATFGDNTALSFTITHGLNNSNPIVYIKRTATPFEKVEFQVESDPGTPNAIIIRANAPAPTTNQFTVIVHV